jgi:hypothetical protein
VKLNLLDDGVVDTFGSVGATSDVETSVPSTLRTARASLVKRIDCHQLFDQLFQQTRLTHNDGKNFTARGPAIRNRQKVIEPAVILWKSLPSRRRPTPRYDGRSPTEWRILASWSAAQKEPKSPHFANSKFTIELAQIWIKERPGSWRTL